ncbi:threonine-rich protein-like isoform X1 [Littorina saxatilis]|uniref:Uncharacterized protein n=2 Tax=Littorina saxatilis TaxID=31220 RepID=A0AAN9GCI9_9CAEN
MNTITKKMVRLLFIALVVVAARAATVPPLPDTTQDVIPDTSSQAPPDIVDSSSSAPPPLVTDTLAPVVSSSAPDVTSDTPDVTTDAPVTTDATSDAPVVTTDAPDVITAAPHVTTAAPTDAPSVACNTTLVEIQLVYNFTNSPDFRHLSENQQIFLYEVLAAAEACRLRTFISPETMQRTFLLTEDLPLKYVYTFISFLARSMEREGIVVPV